MSVDIDTPYPLSADQIEQFARDGFIRLKHVFDAATLDHFGRAITERTVALNTQTAPIEERSTYDKAFLQVMNLWREDPCAREFVFGKRLAGIAAALLQVEGVRLYHDQSLYKEPGGGITPAHADQYYWPLSSDRTITAWVPLRNERALRFHELAGFKRELSTAKTAVIGGVKIEEVRLKRPINA